ncbi:Mob1/phocein [Bisporella sp. PMI_857]|nr:Mob1/phocein [Bisporella sp. PMI_857]
MSLGPSSPRLPSPPPPTEIQIASPSLGSSKQESTIEQSIIDANSSRRIHPGTKSADMAAGPPLVTLGELDSAFQLQEHLKALHYHYTKPSESIDSVVPINRETALKIATPPDNVERTLWLYELCRFLINKCNDLIIGFLFDDPPCSATTCPEMRASEWQFLCAVHETPKSCCAIDYCCHTLDWATNIVTSQKIFPSRLSLEAGDSTDDRGAGVKHLVNIFRRLHRIFAHAWFQHRDVFWRVEGQTGLYVLFKMVCDSYQLLPKEAYQLPPEAEGLEPAPETKPAMPKILQPAVPSSSVPSVEEGFLSIGSMGSIGRTNTRRHIRQSPSVGSAVTTVLEAEDEEEPDVTRKLKDLHILDEEGPSEIPVIVESYEVYGHQDDEEPAKEPETEPIEHDNEHPTTVDNSPPNSTTSSWDRMSSDSLEETPEIDEKSETVKEEPLTQTNDSEAEPTTKSEEAEGKDDATEDDSPAPPEEKAKLVKDAPETDEEKDVDEADDLKAASK